MRKLLNWLGRFWRRRPPDSPEAKVELWMRQMRDQVALLDSGVARLRGEAQLARQQVTNTEHEIGRLQRTIEQLLGLNEQQEAVRLMAQKQRLDALLPTRREALAKAEADLQHALRVQSIYLVRQTDYIQRLRALQREATTSALLAEIASIDATLASAARPDLGAVLVDEVEQGALAERARLRVAADLGTVAAPGVHSDAITDDPGLLQTS